MNDKILAEFENRSRKYRLVYREIEDTTMNEVILQFHFQESDVWLDMEFDVHEELDEADNLPTQHVLEMLRLISNVLPRRK